jgi:hypothetical protein
MSHSRGLDACSGASISLVPMTMREASSLAFPFTGWRPVERPYRFRHIHPAHPHPASTSASTLLDLADQ